MTRVISDNSMLLSGFMAASNIGAEEPMGDGGEQLQEWISGEERDRRHVDAMVGADGPNRPTTGVDSQTHSAWAMIVDLCVPRSTSG